MSTPNFALKNASRYFVFGMPVYYTQEDIDEYELDQDLFGKYDELDTEANATKKCIASIVAPTVKPATTERVSACGKKWKNRRRKPHKTISS